jgi:hypothetical protein
MEYDLEDKFLITVAHCLMTSDKSEVTVEVVA